MDCGARVLITSDAVWRGEKYLGLKVICDSAMEKCAKQGHNVEHCIVVSHLARVTSPSGNAQLKKVRVNNSIRVNDS